MRKRWHTDQYESYLKSGQWAEKRQEKLESVNYSCDRDIRLIYQTGEDGILRRITDCSPGPLQVHHRTYANLGNESLDDLVVLCKLHHDQEHRNISAQKIFDSGLETYASKKYGEGWEDDYYDIAEEFQEWLDAR
jgi:hypothetical protein